MSKKLLFLFVFIVFSFVLLHIKYYEFELSEKDIDSSLIGLTINGSSTTNFPVRDSGYAIESILCDKDATGVWDYENWSLRLRNVTQSRTKCQVNFVSKYHENILNGTDPVLKDGLIPVTIDNDGTVKKTSLGWEWYKYEEQKWANAVILNNEYEKYYDGDIIPEEAIESYFVWIPRYKYKIFDMGNYSGLTTIQNKQQIIEVIFGMDTTMDSDNSCKTPIVSGESGTCSVGKYMTHPAFVAFDTDNSVTKGIWVGKFEVGYKGAATANEAEINENNSNKVQIKPDVYSWRGINVANAHLSSYNYKRNLDSHLMKNTEWGAVAYLQHSTYGSHTSVRLNNYSEFKTGYAGVYEPTIGYTGTNISCVTTPSECNEYGINSDVTKLWNTTEGRLASTTSNISGIYDMSGGAWEYVMGVMLNSTNTIPCSGRDATSNSGFNGAYCMIGQTEFKTDGINFISDKKYFDFFQYSEIDLVYYHRILGDATGEMGPFVKKNYGNIKRVIGAWYDDEVWLYTPISPWLIRGNKYDVGTNSGMFATAQLDGSPNSTVSFRIVLVI